MIFGRVWMNLTQLFALKEELLKELTQNVNQMQFDSDEARSNYHDAAMEAIIDFYSKSMILIMAA